METGQIEANLLRLNESAKLPYLDDLIQRKLAGAEKERVSEVDLGIHRGEFERLRGKLQSAFEGSTLPELPAGRAALNDLLVRLRLGQSVQS